MDSSSKVFEDNFKEWLNIADALMTEDVSGESRRMITDQLADLQKLLQKKQKYIETQLEEEIKREDAEIARLQERFERFPMTSSKDQDERDAVLGSGQAEQTEAYDMMPLWYNLKMVEWQEAYDAMVTDTKDNVKIVLDKLIMILTLTFTRCDEAVQTQHDQLEYAALFPGESEVNRKHELPKKRDKDLDDHCTNCQVKTLQFCIANIKKVLVKSLMEDKRNQRLFAADTERLKSALHQYVEACVEFSWVACLETEPVQLITNPRKECKELLPQFLGESEVPKKSFVEWPAIVQNDVIRAAWQLYHRESKKTIHFEEEKEERSEVVKHVFDHVKQKEDEMISQPRAVVYESDNDWSSQTEGSMSNTYSLYSESFNQSGGYYGHAHGRPTKVGKDRAQGRTLPASAAGKLRKNTRSPPGPRQHVTEPRYEKTLGSTKIVNYGNTALQKKQKYEFNTKTVANNGNRKLLKSDTLNF